MCFLKKCWAHPTRIRTIKSMRMQKFGLLGYPLTHSFSKGYFTQKFEREGLSAVYENFAIPTIDAFPEVIRQNSDLTGLNVTIPYKTAVIQYLDELDPAAREIGAVNVVRVHKKSDGTVHLKGYNSDVIGFTESIRSFVSELLKREPHPNALVLGTGGASKAVVYGLKQLGIQPLTVSRTAHPGGLTYDDLTADHYRNTSIFVNTTPLGMSPNIETCPDLDYTLLTRSHYLYDVVYNPAETLFLQKGRAQGAHTCNGLEMLHLQAEAAWKLWND